MVRYLFVVLMVAVFTFSGCATSGDLEKLQLSIDGRMGKVETKVNTDLKTMDTRIADAESKVNVSRNIQVAQADFNTMKLTVANQNKKYDDLLRRVDKFKSEIRKSKSENKNLQRNLDDLESKMDELKAILEEAATGQ